MARPSFQEVFDELNSMQQRKGADYGTNEDPLADLVISERFGIDPWINVMLRCSQKISRLATFVRKGKLHNESVEDSLIDLAVYAIHALRLYREEQERIRQLTSDVIENRK